MTLFITHIAYHVLSKSNLQILYAVVCFVRRVCGRLWSTRGASLGKGNTGA